jgi:hypothetical protein
MHQFYNNTQSCYDLSIYKYDNIKLEYYNLSNILNILKIFIKYMSEYLPSSITDISLVINKNHKISNLPNKVKYITFINNVDACKYNILNNKKILIKGYGSYHYRIFNTNIILTKSKNLKILNRNMI